VPDVLVVGGGPAGTASAIFFRQAGHSVELVDEAQFPRDKVCGEGVSPEAWRLLEKMGAGDAVRALAPHPLRGMQLIAPDGTSFHGWYERGRPPGFAARRALFDAALLEAARRAGVTVHERTRATGLIRTNGRVEGATLACDGRVDERRARLVVVADGRRSFLARALGLLRPHASLRKFAVRGYWSGVLGLGEHGEMHVGGGGYCGVAPLSATEANLAFVLDAADMREAKGDLDAFYRRTLERWPRLAPRLRGASLCGPAKAIGPLALETRRVSVPGAVLVGDAAGFYDPFTGEGVTLALRSAEMAAQAGHVYLTGQSAGLKAYDRQRREATRHKFRLNRLLQHVVASTTLANAVAARLARRQDLADMLVGVAGDYVPARNALGPSFLYQLLKG
jgi:menaquinone-9 beta-reductase